MNFNDIRKETLNKLKKNRITGGFEILPLLDNSLTLKTEEEIFQRALCINIIVASSFSEKIKQMAMSWVNGENLDRKLSSNEALFLEGKFPKEYFQTQQECLYSFGWILGLIDSIDISKYVPVELVTKYPDLRIMESSKNFLSRIKLRTELEIIQELDLFYCLDWYYSNLRIQVGIKKARIAPLAIKERRRSLEWVLSDQDWDDVILDT